MTRLGWFGEYGTAGQGVAHALGWTLLHFCWEGAAVGILLWCALGLLGGRSSRARYAAACVALALTVALPVGTFARMAWAEHGWRHARHPAARVEVAMTLWVGPEDAEAWPDRVAERIDAAAPWLLLAWFAGATVFLGRLQVGLLVTRRIRAVATEPVTWDLLERFEGLRRQLGVSRPVRLLNSAMVQAPTVIGWLHPVVLVPVSCFTGLSPVQVEAILRHELAHVLRHDYLVSVLQSTVEALLFYHPAVWWVSMQVRRERECCCDEVAIGSGGDVLAYARALSTLEARRAFYPEDALGANGGVLTMRMRRLLGYTDGSAGSQVAATVVLTLLLGAVGATIGARAEAKTFEGRIAAAMPVALLAPGDLSEQLAAPTLPRLRLGSYAISMAGLAGAQATGSPDWDTPAPAAGGTAVGGVSVLSDTMGVDFGPYLRVLLGGLRRSFLSSIAEEAKPPQQQEGSVVVRFSVLPDGQIGSMNLETASGNAALDRAAWLALTGAGKFQPLPVEFHGAKLDLRVRFVDSMQPRLGATGGAFGGTAAQAPMGPVWVSGGVMAANLISRPNPVYPAEAKAAHVSGSVVLRALISKTGEVENLRVVSGPEMLRGSAVDAVSQWKYKPYLLNGEPTEVDTTITVNYSFGDGPASGDQESGSGGVGAEKGPAAMRVSSGLMAANLISKFAPVYPAEAKANHVQGAVVLRAVISKDGSIANLQVVSGPRELMASALDAVRLWKYKPYLLNGESTEVETTITVNYSLAGEEGGATQGAGPGGMADGEGSTPMRVSSALMAKQLVSRVDPVYPAGVKNEQSGASMLRVVISKSGDVENVQGISGQPELMPRLIDAVRQWRYQPYLLNGEPREVETTVIFHLRANGAEGSMTPLRPIGNGISAPRVLSAPEPTYTDEARKRKVSGNVLVALQVDEQGRATHLRVVRGLGSGLDEKAMEAVQQYRFRPAMEDGKPVPVDMNIEVNFSIF